MQRILDLNEAPAIPRDKEFNEFLYITSADEKMWSAVCWAEALIAVVQTRKRRRAEADLINFRITLNLVLANALYASRGRIGQRVRYARRREAYSGQSPYFPSFLSSKVLTNTIDALERCGLLATTTGRRKTKAQCGRQSTFAATPTLLNALAEQGVFREDVKLQFSEAPVVILKDENKRRIPYEPETAHLQQMIGSIRRYNRFLREHDLGLRPNPFEDVATIDFGRTDLRRIFNNGDWRQGGRFYRAWWQRVHSPSRQYITIDGCDTIELDFSGFHPGAIYHNKGLTCPLDPYDIPAIREAAEAQGMDWEIVRDSLKLMFNALINAPPGKKIGGITGLKLPKGITRKKAFELIEEYHHLIADTFRTGEGLRVMNQESEVCERILMDGLKRGIVILPIHDSFIVQARHEGWLRETMVSNYRRVFSFDPIIKKKGAPSRDNQIIIGSIDSPLELPSRDSFIGETISREIGMWDVDQFGEYETEPECPLGMPHCAPLPLAACPSTSGQ